MVPGLFPDTAFFVLGKKLVMMVTPQQPAQVGLTEQQVVWPFLVYLAEQLEKQSIYTGGTFTAVTGADKLSGSASTWQHVVHMHCALPLALLYLVGDSSQSF